MLIVALTSFSSVPYQVSASLFAPGLAHPSHLCLAWVSQYLPPIQMHLETVWLESEQRRDNFTCIFKHFQRIQDFCCE